MLICQRPVAHISTNDWLHINHDNNYDRFNEAMDLYELVSKEQEEQAKLMAQQATYNQQHHPQQYQVCLKSGNSVDTYTYLHF